MALPDYARVTTGTAITCRATGLGGTHLLTLTSLANGAARQGDKIDFGASRARRWRVVLKSEHAATPTARAVSELFMGWSSSGTAGTDNPGGLGGADAAYTGQSSNLEDSLQQLSRCGDFVASALATANVQVAELGIIEPPMRYGCPVLVNRTGAAYHSSATNMSLEFHPIVDVLEDT